MAIVTTVVAAAFAEFELTALVGTIASSLIGGRSDDFLCKGANKLYNRIRAQSGEPVNRDLQRAVRRSYLQATLSATNHVWATKARDYRYGTRNHADLSRIESYLKDQLEILNAPEIKFQPGEWPQAFRHLLEPQGTTIKKRRLEYKDALKSTVLGELEQRRWQLGEDTMLIAYVREGWTERAKRIDWYELTCAFFMEELKEGNERLLRVVQQQYFATVLKDMQEVSVTVDEVAENLAQIREEYDQFVSQLDQIMTINVHIRKDVTDLQRNTLNQSQKLDELLSLVREGQGSQVTFAELPNIALNHRYQSMVQEVTELELEVSKCGAQVKSIQIALGSSPAADVRNLGNKLQDAQANLIRLNESRSVAINKLKTFVSQTIDLAQQLRISVSPYILNLRQARDLVEVGDFEGVQTLITSSENAQQDLNIAEYSDTEAAVRSADAVLKAKAVQVNRPPGWVQLCIRYYTTACKTYKDLSTIKEFGDFLISQGRLEEGKLYYQEGLTLSTNLEYKSQFLYSLAEAAVSEDDIVTAKNNYHEILFIYRNEVEKVGAELRYGIAGVLFQLGMLYSHTLDTEDAIEYLGESLKLRRELYQDDYADIKPLVGTTLVCLGKLNIESRHNDVAIPLLEEGIDIFRELLVDDAATYSLLLANVLSYLGTYLIEHSTQMERGKDLLLESLTLHREYSQHEPLANTIQAANVLFVLGDLYKAEENFDLAKRSFTESLAFFRELASFNYENYGSRVGAVLTELALINIHTEDSSNEEILAIFFEALTTYRRLAAVDPIIYYPKLADCLQSVGTMYTRIDNSLQALIYLEESRSIIRDHRQNFPDTFSKLEASILDSLGMAHIKCGDVEDGLKCMKEAVDIHRNGIERDADMHQFSYAESLVYIAKVCEQYGRTDEAANYYRQAISVSRELDAVDPQKYRIYLVRWLNNFALLPPASGDKASGLPLLRESLDLLLKAKYSSSESELRLQSIILDNLGLVLSLNGKFSEALEVYDRLIVFYKGLGARDTNAFQIEIGAILNRIGVILHNLGEFKSGLIYFDNSYNTLCALVESDTFRVLPECAQVMSNMAKSYKAMNVQVRSEICIEAAVDMYEFLFNNNPEVYEKELREAHEYSKRLSGGGFLSWLIG